MKKILVKYNSIVWVLLLGLIIWPLFLPGYFSHHDDLQVMRIVEMRKCLVDFQIPCRWVPDMGFGNGYPLFNYYSVFPYYIGAILSFLVGYILAAKLLFALPIIIGAISMYILAKELFGKTSAIIAAVLFSFAPYRALDIYVRGAVGESFAMAIIPLTFYFAIKLIIQRNIKYLTAFSLSLASFLISHNIMTLLFIPPLLVFIIIFLIKEKWKNIFFVVLGFILGIGLSSFFIFPAYFEKNLVQIDNLIKLDLNFRAHYVTINQLFFNRLWGYGASSPGTDDTISFQIGWPHWWVVITSSILIILNLVKKRRFIDYLALVLLCFFLLSIFMTHIKSAFIWEKIEILKFTQFPWRFLAVAIFISSLLGTYLIQTVKESNKIIFVTVLSVLTILLNWSYFKPEKFYFDMTNQKKLSGKLWEEQQKAAILDYLPQTAIEPKEVAPNKPLVTKGKADIEKFENYSNRWKFKTIIQEKNSTIEIPVFDFPNWQVKVNNQKIEYSNKNLLGRISINFDRKGQYMVSGEFKDTNIRRVSNLLSVISFVALIWIIYGNRQKSFK